MIMNHVIILFAVSTLFVGCRARQWDESSGVLDSDESTGRVSVRCFENIENSEKPVWLFQVSGAHSSTDQEQPLQVSVQKKLADAGAVSIANAQSGRGVVSKDAGIFLGYESGALTADQADQNKAGFFGGLLTMTGNSAENSAEVLCEVRDI